MRRVVLGLAVVVVLACDDSSTGDGGRDTGLTTPLTLEAYCSVAMQRTCEAGTRCGLYDSVETCRALLTSARTVDPCTLAANAVAKGRVRFDGAAARACLTALEQGCSAPVCDDVFVGQVAEGGACYTFAPRSECAAGSTCRFESGCPGRCLALQGRGTVVSRSDLCREELAAVPVPDAGELLYVCDDRVPVGSSCEGAVCVSNALCNLDTKRCEALRAPGETCPAGDGGPWTAWQVPDLCDPRHTGHTCTPSATGATCEPLAGLNEPCGRCADDLQCGAPDGGAPRCVPLGRIGDFCAAFSGCIEGFCSPNAGASGPGLCTTRARLGEPCEVPDACEGDTACVSELTADGGRASTCRTIVQPWMGLSCFPPP